MDQYVPHADVVRRNLPQLSKQLSNRDLDRLVPSAARPREMAVLRRRMTHGWNARCGA